MKRNPRFESPAILQALAVLLTLLFSVGASAQVVLPQAVRDADYFYEGAPPADMVLLGKNLFWDKLLSGEQNDSCGTCHNPQIGAGDSLSLGLGAGGQGSGMVRVAHAVKGRIIRNALSIYNAGAKQNAFYGNDGEFALRSDGRFDTPGGILPNATITGLDNLLAAQALFPLTATREQAGTSTNNAISRCAAQVDRFCVWNGYLDRIKAVPGYVSLFMQVFPTITDASGIEISHVVNAIAAYETVAFRSDDSPFDQYLRGDASAMSPKAIAGMNLFYGTAGCSSCHSGVFQTDNRFHAIAMPQIGQGRRDGISGKDDGRIRVTRLQSDLHKYKTPSLRNVVLTGPWSHAGAYTSLEAVIRHHLNPPVALNQYDTSQAILPPIPDVPSIATTDFQEFNDVDARTARARTNELAPHPLTDEEVAQLMAFMHALTGASVFDVKDKVPMEVISGLPVAD